MYACIVFLANGEAKRWKYVRDLKSFSVFLSKAHPTWKYFNVYEKGTKTFLKRFYEGNIIPKVLPLLIFLVGLLTQKFTFNETFNLLAYENTFNKTTFNKPPLKPSLYDFNNTATIQTLSLKGGAEC
jgi:hypothetical protein